MSPMPITLKLAIVTPVTASLNTTWNCTTLLLEIAGPTRVMVAVGRDRSSV